MSVKNVIYMYKYATTVWLIMKNYVYDRMYIYMYVMKN
jgi:hypothetical protein